MHCDEIEKLDHAGRVNPFVSTKARRRGMLRITQVDQSDRELRLGQFLVGEFLERRLRRVVHKLLQRSSARKFSAGNRISRLTAYSRGYRREHHQRAS